jgi:hypothetical protein
MNIKANTISKKKKIMENVVGDLCVSFHSCYLNKHFIRYVCTARRFVISCVHVVLLYCKERDVPCGEGGFGLSLQEGLGVQREYEEGLLLHMALREDAGDGYSHVFCHFVDRKTAWRL